MLWISVVTISADKLKKMKIGKPQRENQISTRYMCVVYVCYIVDKPHF